LPEILICKSQSKNLCLQQNENWVVHIFYTQFAIFRSTKTGARFNPKIVLNLTWKTSILFFWKMQHPANPHLVWNPSTI